MQIEQLSNDIAEFINQTDKIYISITKIDKTKLNKRNKQLFNLIMKYYTIHIDKLQEEYFKKRFNP